MRIKPETRHWAIIPIALAVGFGPGTGQWVITSVFLGIALLFVYLDAMRGDGDGNN